MRSRAFMLFGGALLAMSVAIVLSPSGKSASAWYQSPVSPVPPVSPVLTESPSTPASSPTAVPTPTSISDTRSPTDTPVASDSEPSQSSGPTTATLVAGGIVLIGLITGAVLLLVRGQPPDESAS